MKKLFTIITFCCLMAACAEHDSIVGNKQSQWPIQISSSYPSVEAMTRAVIDGGFVAGDEMGIFIVDRDENGEKGEVMIQGNRASNVRFTLQENGTWQAETQFYWANNETAADFYGYYPFDNALNAPTNYAFSVEPNQVEDDNRLSSTSYTKSDLLWAKAEKVMPTSETVNLAYKHLMAGVTIRLEQGTGFTDVEWAAFDKTVLIKNTILSGSVNLVEGTTTVGNGNVQSVKPLKHEGVWRGVVFPQTVVAGKPVISVTVDGQSYLLENNAGITFLSGKMHVFTITVNRSSGTGQFEFVLTDESITPWQDDAELHEGLIRQYAIVKVENPGTLQEALIAQKIDWETVENLKVSGNVNQSDLEFLSKMPSLINLNLQQIQIEDSVFSGFYESRLQHLVMPEKGIKRIAPQTLQSPAHLTGSLVIPEGVEVIGWGFCGGASSMTVLPKLPSTLKRCEGSFFQYSPATGDFKLPDGIEVWYGGVENGTGEMYLPSSLKELADMPYRLTGTIKVPQGCKLSDFTFQGSHCTSLILPEGLTNIPNGCFGGSQISGELVLPSTLERVNGFAGTKISSIVFPENLKIIEASAFQDCSRLQGTIIIPKKVVKIPVGCFSNCPMLTGVVFHKDIHIIEDRAFEMCENLNSIVCEGEEPPAVGENAFLGVPKDNFTLEVPKGCVEKYRQARGWGEFKRIAEYSGFVCRPAQVQALNQNHSEDLVLNAEGDWTVIEKPSWVKLSKENGTGKVGITMTAQTLNHGAGNRQGDIVFRMEQDGKSYETRCHVSQYDYEYDEDSYLTLQKASKGNNGSIDIVFAGDGWDGASISDGSYLDLIRYQTECFFAIEPYRSMREYFNVYVTFPLSQEKGVNTMHTYVNNHFGTLYGRSSLAIEASNQLITESDEVFDYAVLHTPMKEEDQWRSLVVLVPNTTEYEGHTEYTWDGRTLSICPPSELPYPRDTRGVIQHEAGGHGFGKLGDESFTINAFAPLTVRQYVDEMHGRGWFANLASTGKLSSVPWAEFIFDPVYSDYVDVYEGGYGYTRLIYRPESNSCMNYGIPYYNTPSRLDIWKRIKDYVGEEWTMEEFRAQDTFEWGPTEITRGAAMPNKMYATGNHQMPTLINFREIGDKVRHIREQLKRKQIKR